MALIFSSVTHSKYILMLPVIHLELRCVNDVKVQSFLFLFLFFYVLHTHIHPFSFVYSLAFILAVYGNQML